MNFCPNCGKQLMGNENFCNSCGTKIAKNPEQKTDEKNYTAPKPFQTHSTIDPNQPVYEKTAFKGKQVTAGTSGEIKFNTGKKKKGGCLSTILKLLVVIIVLGVAAMLFLGGSGITNVNTAEGFDPTSYEPINKTSTFNVNTPEIFVTFSLSDLPVGTYVYCEWIYLDQNISIITSSIQTTMEEQNAYFSLTRPDNGWPTGEYQVKLFVDEKTQTSVNFKVKSFK